MSEPVFEASVRLRVETGPVEEQGLASLKRVTDRLEASAQRSLRAAQLSSSGVPVLPGFAPNTTANDVLTQAITKARALAAQPVEFEIVANTQQFEQQTGAAYKQAVALATRQVDVARQIATTAAQEATAATDATITAGAGRTEAIVVARTKQAVSRAARAAVEEAQAALRKLEGEAADVRLRPETELQTRAQTAAVRSETFDIRGDAVASEAAALEAAVLGAQGAAQTYQRQASEFLAAAQLETGAEQAMLQAKADNAIAQSEKLRLQADRLQREGFQPVSTPGREAGQAGALGGLGGILRHEAGGRSSGLLGLLGGGLRFGVAGLAFTAAFEGLRELQGLLRADGDEAFTTEGKIRNLGAELLGGNLIGGIRALAAEKPATFTGGLEEEVKRMKDAQDETIISADRLLSLQRSLAESPKAGTQAFQEQQQAAKGLSGELNQLPQQIAGVTDHFNRAPEAIKGVSGAFNEVPQAAKGTEDAMSGARLEIDGASDSLEDFLAAQVASGHASAEHAREIGLATLSLDRQAEAASLASASFEDYQRSVARAGDAAARFGREGGPEGLRGPGNVASQGVAAGQGAPGAVTGQQTTGIPRPIITNPFPNPVFQAPDQDVAAATRDAFAERIQNDQERLQAQLKNLRLTQQQKRTAFEEAKAAKEQAEAAGDASAEARKAAAAYSDLAKATTAVGDKAAELRQAAEATREAIAAAGDRSRDAQTARIADPDARLRAQLGDARQDESEAAAAVAAAKRANKSAKEIAEANATYQEAITARANIEQQISDNAKAAAQIAADDARNAEEVRLANNIAAAAQTEGKADDKKFYNEAIAHYREVAADASETKTAREQARGTVRELLAGRKQALSGGDPNQLVQQQLANTLAQAEQSGKPGRVESAAGAIVRFWQQQVKSLDGIDKAQAQASLIAARGNLAEVRDQRLQNRTDLQQQRIENRIAAARLTQGTQDDKKAADALVAFWQRQVKEATGLDKERKRSQLIAARLARQGLDEQGDQSSGSGFGTIDFLGISQSIMRDFAGNLLPTGSSSALQDFFGGGRPPLPGLDTASDTRDDELDELRRIRQLLERRDRQPVQATVHVNQTYREPDPSGFAQARFARFAMEEAFNG